MSGTDYEAFLEAKHLRAPPSGFEAQDIPSGLFPFQRDVVSWACKRGKAALFLSTGLGKTACQLAWAREVVRHSGGRVLILAPLAVALQTVREGQKFGISLEYARAQDASASPIVITNYDMLHEFDAAEWTGVVLDESSIVKSHDGKTRTALIEAFAQTPYRLACTATPSPNDYMELGNHSEFLGVMTRAEMLATFFVHDGGETQQWRLKGHAESEFWKWVCSWSVLMQSPADLGYAAGGYDLPALHVHTHVVPADHADAAKLGTLFLNEARTLSEQRAARRVSLGARVAVAAGLVNGSADPWLLWCELNDEGNELAAAIPDAVQVAGADERDVKESRLLGFADGRHRVLVSKSSIAGFGLNLQVCAHMAFVGISHSWESFFQAIRRCWRFGQTREVHAHVIISELEAPVLANLMRKEGDAKRMADEMSSRTAESVRANIRGAERELRRYAPTVPMEVPAWLTAD